MKTVGLGIGLRLAENGGSSIYQALAVSYVVGVVGVSVSVGPLCLIFAPLLGALIVPLSGILTDRYGRVIVTPESRGRNLDDLHDAIAVK
jgi:MFS transporter, MHS family, metabolite:H+ symporter